jgi:hypothetical protein
VKIEAEAWELATKEYKELLKDMCEHKLAPNLPYMKSLFLGWFEPFTDAIAKEKELIGTGKSRQGYAPYFDLLPADKMSVIAMHHIRDKSGSLIMTKISVILHNYSYSFTLYICFPYSVYVLSISMIVQIL